MRARQPDLEGIVRRDGATIAYEVYGRGEPTLLLVPASPIVHGRSWKLLSPTLARRFAVLVTDGRGTGRSDRCHDPHRHAPAEVIADLLAVLDATDVDRCRGRR